MILVRFQDKPFNITVIQVYAPTADAEEAAVEQLCEDLQDHLELTAKKKNKSFFHYRGRKAKERSQDIPGVTAGSALDCKMKQGKG